MNESEKQLKRIADILASMPLPEIMEELKAIRQELYLRRIGDKGL